MTSTCPVRAATASSTCSMPRHSAASRNSVVCLPVGMMIVGRLLRTARAFAWRRPTRTQSAAFSRRQVAERPHLRRRGRVSRGHCYRCARDVRPSYGGAAVSDILGQGKDREPRRWWWPLAVIAAGIAVLLGVLTVGHLPQHRHAMARPARTSAAAHPAAPASGGQAAGPGMPPRKPARMGGRPLSRDARLRVLLGGHRPAWLSVTTGRTEPIEGLPRRGNGYQLIRVAGGWAAQPFPSTGSTCANCAPRPSPVYYVADGSRVASRLGAADFVAPAATRGAVWLVSYRAGALMAAAAGTAREFSVTGAALGPRRRLPPGYVISQGTGAGLLLVPELAGPGGVRYQLWDPGTRRVSRFFPNVIAASPGEIAWMPDCTARCTVHVLDLDGGRPRPRRVIALPGRSRSYAGAFSPGGRLLALQVTARIGAGGRPAANRLVVAVVATGSLTGVPGTTVGSGNGVDFGWQAGSGRLVAEVDLQHAWQIAVWRPGDARMHVAVTRAPAGSWPVVGQGPY